MQEQTKNPKPTNQETPAPATVSCTEGYVSHPEGKLFVQQWQLNNRSVTPHTPANDIPIILMHDSLGSVGLWRDFPEQLCLKTGFSVLAYDRLGFGKSSPRHGKMPLNFVADEAKQYFSVLKTALEIKQFIAFGHSVGGGMAVNMAASFPQDCRALITESAQAFVEDKTLAGLQTAQALFQDPAQVQRLAKYHGDKAEWVLGAWLNTWLHPDFANWSLHAVLPQVRCPVLALHGEHDEYGSARHPEMIAQESSGQARCEILPQTYHVPHRENPTAVLALVSQFLQETQLVSEL